MGLCSCRPVRSPILTPVHHRKHLQWAREHQNWTMEQWKKVPWSNESRFLLHHVDSQVHIHLWAVMDKQVRFMEAPSCNLQDLKNLLLMSWCQIPQHTFRAIVESIPRQIWEKKKLFHFKWDLKPRFHRKRGFNVRLIRPCPEETLLDCC
ncbi:hypothetical protein PGIGA_G00110650 [Pangasianodon gigas]|uniref:Uncharacterized protein n=1 Tax=Pangasianodon gigas TaxID=30993 RepID=A0ACC5W8W2_PANGG|nr:hypothetical protein [Pangasianodon gigas]